MRERSCSVGETDYTGVELADIHRHFGEWRDESRDVIAALRTLGQEAKDNFPESDNLQGIQNYISHFIDLFSRYQYDFDRLVSGVKREVKDTHVEVVSQLFQSCEVEESRCVLFKDRQIDRDLPDESMRPLLDRVYSITRDLLLSLKDLSNLKPRLRTFIGEGLQRRGPSSSSGSARREVLKVVQGELDKGTDRDEPFYIAVLRVLDQADDIVQEDKLLQNWRKTPNIHCWTDVQYDDKCRKYFQSWLSKIKKSLEG